MAAKDLCKVPADIPHKSNKADQFFMKELREEKRFIKELDRQELAKSAGDVRGREKKQWHMISEELRNEKIKEFLERSRRKQLVENTEDLRNLKRQIAFADAFRQLAQQTEQLEKERHERISRKIEEDKDIKSKFQEDDRKHLEKEKELAAGKMAYRDFLLKQLEELNASRKRDVNEINAERERVRLVLEMYDAREAAELKKIADMKKETRMELDRIVAEQRANAIALREKEKELLKQNEEFLASKNQQEYEREMVKIEKQREANEKAVKIREILMVELEEKERREKILAELLVKEKLAIDNQKYREALVTDKRHRMRFHQEMLLHLEQTREERAFEREREIKEGRATNAQALKEQQEIDRNAILKKKKDQQELRTELFNAINYNKEVVGSLFVQRQREEEERSKIEKRKMEEIYKERMDILKEQPKDILKYLPPAVLSDAEKHELGLISKN